MVILLYRVPLIQVLCNFHFVTATRHTPGRATSQSFAQFVLHSLANLSTCWVHSSSFLELSNGLILNCPFVESLHRSA
ncbi:hypothetical protein L596_003410 [Steinernema carpocapsae]|uniref:Secreted protein n=1 Tax=Steinernema carpocapsae TaxID=34508 RepID=A0A4U8USH7_STECR|nr:hypothetical protein L596_003410 [Steinernema carpocapsae]